METAWLLEKKGHTLWWNGRPKREGIQAWTSSSLDAVRFSRQYDAEICAISQGYSLSSVLATEHQWG